MICGCIKAKYSARRLLLGNVFFNCFIENSALDIFELTCAIWGFHDKDSSMYIPRNFIEVSLQFLPILFRGEPLTKSAYLFRSHCLCWGLKTIYFVLPGFNDSLLAQNQLNKLFVSI